MVAMHGKRNNNYGITKQPLSKVPTYSKHYSTLIGSYGAFMESLQCFSRKFTMLYKIYCTFLELSHTFLELHCA
jgi:hypothetical protein